jgi:hypothetical protein
MAVYTGTVSISKSLAGAAVDTVTLSGRGKSQVYNRGVGIIWFRSGRTAAAITDPTVAGDDCMPVMPGTKEPVSAGHAVVKIIGSGDAYTVLRS